MRNNLYGISGKEEHLALKTLKREEIEKLKEMIDSHDCKLSRDGGCICTHWWTKKIKLEREL